MKPIGILGVALLAPEPGEQKLAKIGDEADARARRLPRLDRMALLAARQALGTSPKEGLGLVVGTGWGGLQATVDFLEGLATRGSPFGSPTAFHESVHHAPAGQISIQLGITGPSLTASARELSGEASLRAAVDLISSERAPRVLVVCADEVVPALASAFEAFGTTWKPEEGAAALLLGREPAAVQLDEVAIGAVAAPVLRFGAPPKGAEGPGLNPSGGLLRVARAAQALAGKAPGTSETLESQSLGGAWGRVRLSRAR